MGYRGPCLRTIRSFQDITGNTDHTVNYASPCPCKDSLPCSGSHLSFVALERITCQV